GLDRGGEAGPAAVRLELLARGEERLAAGGAAEGAPLLGGVVLAAEGRLGALLAEHPVLIGRQLLAPLGVGLLDLLGHGGLRGRLAQPGAAPLRPRHSGASVAGGERVGKTTGDRASAVAK